MIKPQKLIVIPLLLVLIICSGCQKHNANKSTPGASVDKSGTHIQKQLDNNLNVNAEVSAPSDIEKFRPLLVTLWKLDQEKTHLLKNQCIGKSEITKQDVSDGHTYYQTADGKQILIEWNNNISGTTTHFTTSNFSPYISQLLFRYIRPGEPYYNYEHLSRVRNQNLPFMPCSQAAEEVKRTLASLGIIADQEEVYGLDYKSLQAEEKRQKDEGALTDPRDGSIMLKDQWDKEDDCYFMVFHCSLDGLRVYPDEHGSVDRNTIVCGSVIRVCYSKRGFEFLVISSPYQKAAVEQETTNILSAEEALAKVAQKYDNIILTEPTTITAIELYYVPTLMQSTREKYRMVPAWCFKAEKKIKGEDEPQAVYSRIIIDATTGGEIL